MSAVADEVVSVVGERVLPAMRRQMK
jgi:hypothetical protein